jgi:hypothetical protein
VGPGRTFEEADWKAVVQSDLGQIAPLRQSNTVESPLAGTKSPHSLWSAINTSNWEQIKKKKINFLQHGVTKDNFNSIKIKPVRNPEEYLSRTTLQPQRAPRQYMYQPKRTLTNADLFRKRKRGLQTLSTITNPAIEEII